MLSTRTLRLAAILVVPLAILLTALRPTPRLLAAARPGEVEVYLIDGGVSPPLRDIPTGSEPKRGVPLLDFAGLGNGDYGFVPQGVPAHANGAVGATQYMHYANDSFAIFDKTTGALLYGPSPTGPLFTFLPRCADNHTGALVVRYDAAANRWVAIQPIFEPGLPGPAHCLAVSTTADATGTWRAITLGFFGPQQTLLSTRLGIWPDAYYVTADIQGDPFRTAYVCAIERTAMLGTTFPRFDCPSLLGSPRGFVPGDLDGSRPPPAGSPSYLLTLGSSTLDLWRFRPNFGASPSFTGPTPIPVTPFTLACAGTICIPQPDTAQLLDSVGDRLMPRLVYRNFGDHESLVANHSVDAGGGVTGVRWYEIRNPGGAPTVHQQGTYSPDPSHRWVGSIAMDRSGDIAVGYSVSSSSVYPSIRYAGRVPSDPAGTLQAEKSLIEGSGSQLTSSEWGGSSSLSLDPADDCTFYFTNAYLKNSGNSNWSTRIGAFRFPSCGASDFYTLTPCRLADTRGPTGPSGGPALAGGATRSFPVAGFCAVPPEATSIALNVTAIQAASMGYLTLYAGDAPQPPLASTLNFSAGQTRGSNAIVALPLGGLGTIKVRNGSAGAVDLVLDVAGYFK